MPVPFDGAVLRKARKASSNDPNTSDPDIVVLDRESNGTDNDRDVYLNAYVNDQIEEQEEFLVLAHSTGNIIEKGGTVQETAEAIDDQKTLYQFNKEDYNIVPGSLNISPTPDDFDRDAGTITYQNQPAQAPDVEYEREPLKVNYVKNDSITRFGFDSKLDKWLPRPGNSPTLIGDLPETGLLEVPEVKDGLTPRVVIGSPDSNNGILVPTTVVTQPQFQQFKNNPSSINSGEAVVSEETSEIQFEQGLIDNNVDRPVYAFQYDFFGLDTNGKVGTADEDVLVLNPIPKDPNTGDNLQPLVRAGFRTYLNVNPSTSTTGNEDAVWDVNTGRLTLQTSEFDGEEIYYDGVLNNTSPIESFPSTELGELASVPDPVAIPKDQSGNPLTIDASTYGDSGFIIYVEETGEVIPRVEKVDKDEVEFELGFLDTDLADGFKPSYNLSPDKAQIAKNSNDDWEIQLGFLFRLRNAGNTLRVGTGDFLIENGITFRMNVSNNDPKNLKDIPDARASERISDAVINDSISRGPFASIEQIPLVDIPGYDENSFFKRKDGLKETILDDNQDIVHDFNNDQIRWSEVVNNSHLITSPVADFDLDYSALHDENFTFELDEGQGFQELEDGSNTIINFDIGKLSFINRKGELLYQGAGEVSGDELSTNEVDFNFNTPPSTLGKFNKPVLIVNEEDAYRIVEQVNSSTIRVHQNFPSSQNRVNFQVLDAPEVLFRYGFHNVDLSERVIFPRKVIQEPNYVPDGESFDFYVNGSSVNKEVLENEVLGTPIDDQGNQNTFFIPQYFRNSNAEFDIIRDRKTLTDVSPNSPSNADEYRVDLSTGEIFFDQQMYDQYENSDIIFVPSLSQNRSTGPVEVLKEDRSVGLPNDINRSDLSVRVQLPESEYTKQRGAPTLFFNETFSSGEQLVVKYTDTKGNTLEEEVGFRFREDIDVSPGQKTFTFGANKEIDTTRDIRVLVNGSPVNATVDAQNKEVEISPFSGSRRVTVEYAVINATGGENSVTLNNKVKDTTVEFDPNSDTQSFSGNYTNDLEADDILIADNQAFIIQNVSFSGGETEVVFQSEPLGEITSPDTVVSSEPITGFVTKNVTMQDNSAGEDEIILFGDQTKNIIKDHILLINDDPYHIRDVRFDSNNSVTVVELTTDLLQEYVSPNIHMTPYQIYEPNADILESQNLAISGNDYDLIKFDSNDDGRVLEKQVEYTFRDDGRVRLDRSNTSLPQIGEYWLLAYTGRDIVRPTQLQGNRFQPRLRASYVRFINANSNNFEGEELRGTYTFRSRDSFYFRVVPLEDIAEEVSEDIEQNLESNDGPTVGFNTNRPNYEEGETTFQLDVSNLRDRDRVGRRQIEFYHKVANSLENYLQILDGRIIGDQDGRFKFFRAPDGQRGGEDPVTGELIDYYANPDGSGTKPDPTVIESAELDAQEGYIRNSIDDIILTSKTPYEITFNAAQGISITFRGTFKNAWEPSRFSRFYPEEASIFTLTTPDRDFILPDPLNNPKDQSADDQYTFLPDFGNLLADLKTENILSISTISERQSKGWLIDGEARGTGSGVEIDVGMVQSLNGEPAKNNSSGDGTLKNGWNRRSVPGFQEPGANQEGDVVSIGRMKFEQDPTTGVVERNPVVYAHNMQIASISGDTITLTKVNNPGEYEIATDPATLQEGNNSASGSNFTAAYDKPQKNDTLFSRPKRYYRLPIDMGANQSEGELRNRKLPQAISDLLGQRTPDPLTYLDVDLSFKSTRQTPRRFPALDGALVDDDKDNKPPYAYPQGSSEVQRIEKEKSVYDKIKSNTSEPISLADGEFLNTSQVEISRDLGNTLPVAKKFNAVLVEGVKENGESEKFSLSESSTSPDTFTLAAKNANGRDWVVENGLEYTLESLYQSTGYRDPGSIVIWIDDQGRDFTDFSGAQSNATLHIGTSSYDIVSFNNGSIEVASGISETSGSFRISIDNQPSGSIEDDLNALRDTDIDFSDASGQFEILNSAYTNNGTYEVDYGENEALHPVVVDDQSVGVGQITDFQVDRGTELTRGSGSRDSSNNRRWEDSSTNFNAYQVREFLFLNILVRDSNGRVQSVEVYRVDSVGNGYVITESPIQQSSHYNYVLSSTREFGIGVGAVESGDLVTPYSADNLNIREGNTLIVRDANGTPNSGRYIVQDIQNVSSVGSRLIFDQPMLENEGDFTTNDFPVSWESYRKRRNSPEVQSDLRNVLLERSPIYQENQDASDTAFHGGTAEDMQNLLVNGNYKADHPSTPSLEVLNNLFDAAFENLGEDSNAEIRDFPNFSNQRGLFDSAIDLSGLKDENGEEDYILIENGDNLGFYQVDETLGSDKILLEDTAFAIEKNTPFASNLTLETGLKIRVLRGERFERRTFELFLYEFVNVLNIIDELELKLGLTYNNPDDLIQSTSRLQHYGNPINNALNLNESGNFSSLPIGLDDRLDWIINEPKTNTSGGISLRQEISSVLEGRERLYDLRYAWIDFRINRSSPGGSLIQWERIKDRQDRESIREELDKLRSE